MLWQHGYLGSAGVWARSLWKPSSPAAEPMHSPTRVCLGACQASCADRVFTLCRWGVAQQKKQSPAERVLSGRRGRAGQMKGAAFATAGDSLAPVTAVLPPEADVEVEEGGHALSLIHI